MSTITKAAVLAVAVSISLLQVTYAQQEATPADTEGLAEIVVTGTTRPIEAIRSSNAITLFDQAALQDLNPQSVGELVRSIPGFHAEDSGGEVGNNITPRGFPLAKQAQFTALQRDGMDVFYTQGVLFAGSDRFTRLSNFIDSAQAVRGGSSSIFVGSAPAGYINFLSREWRPGDAAGRGDIQFETNNADRFGFDGWMTGALSDSTGFAAGAWYRADNSTRDPGFTGNKGGEVNANLKHLFADGRGYIRFEFDHQDDHAIFFLPMPLTGSTANASGIPGGPNINSGTTGASANAQYLRLDGTPNGNLDLNLANGQSDQTTYIGTKLSYDLGNQWTAVNQNRYTNLSTPFNAIINVGNATSLTTIATNIYNSATSRFAGAMGANGIPYFIVRDTGTGEVIANQSTADSLNTNGYGIEAAYFYRTFVGTNFQNDLQLQRTFDNFGKGSLSTTFALFYSLLDAEVEDHDLPTLQTVEPSPRRVDIIFTQANGTPLATGAGTYNGLIGGPSGFDHVIYTERTFAPYLDLVYDVGPLNLNFGARYESLNATGQVENLAYHDISNDGVRDDPGNPALTSVPFGNGTFRHFSLNYNKLAWTFGGNYKINNDFSVFARYTKGFRMPDADNYISLASFDANTAVGQEAIREFNESKRPETEPIRTTMGEAGVNFRSHYVDVQANYFFAQANDLFFNVPTVVDGEIVQRQAFRNTRTNGVEADIGLKLTQSWRVSFDGTYQLPKFYDTPIQQALNSAGQTVYLDINGNLPTRTPKVFYQVFSAYNIPGAPLGGIELHASWSVSGLRYADDANTARLPQFGLLNLGFAVGGREGFYVRADVQNALDSKGLTEGDPRAGETLFGAGSTFNARVVDPRLYTLRVGYHF
jgi:outer membrane receptor protein involved in Fe transport